MRKTVGILSGGISRERYLSVRSGNNILAALREDERLEPYVIDWKEPRLWELRDGGSVTIRRSNSLPGLLDGFGIDCVYDAFSGTEEIDGHISAMLDLLGIPCVGNGFYASFTGMDKHITKLLCADCGLPVLPDVVLRRKGEPPPDDIDRSPGFPLVAKPGASGSSVGVALVESREQLANYLREMPNGDFPVLLEKYAKGREFCSSVLFSPKHGRLICPPVVEILHSGQIFDAECKKNGTYSSVRADIPQETQDRMNEMATRLHRSIRATCYSRTDFILCENGDIWLLEINTHPGLGECSILPAQLAEMGLPFREYISSLIWYSMESGLVSEA